MKWLLPLFVLICFTSPDGYPVWVSKEQVAAVTRDSVGGRGVVPRVSFSEIWLTSGNQIYVKEMPDEVAKALQ